MTAFDVAIAAGDSIKYQSIVNGSFIWDIHVRYKPGRVAQSVTCLASDGCLTADPGVASLIPVPYFRGD